MYDKHEEIVMLYTMSNQISELSENFGTFETFKDELGNTLMKMFENQNSIKQELFVIRNKQVELSSSKPDTQPESTFQSSSHPTESSSPKRSAPSASSSSKSAPNAPKIKQKERKTLFVGDSISANVNIKALEIATNSKFSSARAYSSAHDTEENVAKYKTKFPKSNFAEVVPAQLKKDEYQTLVLQAGSVDITNLKTKNDPAAYVEYFKQETVLSAKRFFQTGEKALTAHQALEKVGLMKQTPRYDPANVDPLCIRPALAELYNNTMTECWMNSQFKDKIVIGNHNIDCTGSIKEARYRETKTGRFDGIHLYGSSGQKAYTKSVLNILKFAQLTSSDYDYHKSCPQTRYHQNNMKQKKQMQPGPSRITNANQTRFEVPMQNRFETLSNLSQGNW